jgi:hypothetical protein
VYYEPHDKQDDGVDNDGPKTDEDNAHTGKGQDAEPFSEKGPAAPDIRSNGQEVGHEKAHARQLK